MNSQQSSLASTRRRPAGAALEREDVVRPAPSSANLHNLTAATARRPAVHSTRTTSARPTPAGSVAPRAVRPLQNATNVTPPAASSAVTPPDAKRTASSSFTPAAADSRATRQQPGVTQSRAVSISPATSTVSSMEGATTAAPTTAKRKEGRIVASRYMASAEPAAPRAGTAVPATTRKPAVSASTRTNVQSRLPPATARRAKPADVVHPPVSTVVRPRKPLAASATTAHRTELTTATARRPPPTTNTVPPATTAKPRPSQTRAPRLGEELTPAALSSESRRAMLEQYRAAKAAGVHATPAATAGRRPGLVSGTGHKTVARPLPSTTARAPPTATLANAPQKAGQPLTAKRQVTGLNKVMPRKTPHRLLSHAAAVPLPPSPPASTDVDLVPAKTHTEPKPRPPPQPPPNRHVTNNPELAAAAAVPLPPSPATATHSPRPSTSPPHQPPPPPPPLTATQLLALQTRALQSSYLLAATRSARAKQTQHANSQLVALHKRVAADRSALADAELGVVDARRAIEAVGPVTAAKGRLRELVAVVGALDGAYARFVGAVRDSVVKMPLVGLRMDRPAVVGQVLDAAAGEIRSALAAAAEPLATIETLATALTDARAVADTAAKEMRECEQLAAELRAAAAVRDSHAIGRKQLAASARREGDELAWLIAS